MADANSVSPGLATLGAGGWTVTEPSAGGRFGSVGVLTPQQTLAIQALVSGAGNVPLPTIGKPLAASLDAASGCTASNAALTYVTRVAPNGQTLRGVRVTGNGLAANCSVDIPLTLTSTVPNGRVSLLLYIPPETAALSAGMTFYLGDSGFANFFSRNVTMSRHGWRQFSPAPATSDYTIKWGTGGGAPAFGTTTFAKARVRFDITTGQVPVYEVYAVLEDCGPSPAPICFTFDDCYISQYNLAAPLLERYGLRGSFAVISDLIGSNPAVYMSWDQLRELRDRGHEINVHGPIGGSGSLLNYAGSASRYQSVFDDVSYHRNAIINNGCNINGSANCYVFPQGNDAFSAGDTTIWDALTAIGIKCGRGVDNTQVDMLNAWGAGRPTQYASIIGHSWSSPVTEAANIAALQQRIIDNVAAKRHSVFMGHYVTSAAAAAALEIQASNLELILQTAEAQIATGNAVNVTMTGLYKAHTGRFPV